MKPYFGFALLPVALAGGILIGRQHHGTSSENENPRPPSRTSSPSSDARSSRQDPFGGPSFSLSSMEEVRELFARQRSDVAAARLTIQIESLSAAEIPDIMEMVKEDAVKFPNHHEGRHQLLSSLFNRWAAIDPQGALDYAKNCRPRSFQQTAISFCFGGLTNADPAAAILEMENLPEGELRQVAATHVVGILSTSDPQAALEILRHIDSGSASWYAGNIFAHWARTDPKAAAAAFEKLPPNLAEPRSAGTLAGTWAMTDPEAALAWAKSSKGAQREAAAVEVYKVLAREDPAAAWERAQSEPGHLRAKLLGGMLQTIGDDDPDKALAMLRDMKGSERRIITAQLLEQIS